MDNFELILNALGVTLAQDLDSEFYAVSINRFRPLTPDNSHSVYVSVWFDNDSDTREGSTEYQPRMQGTYNIDCWSFGSANSSSGQSADYVATVQLYQALRDISRCLIAPENRQLKLDSVKPILRRFIQSRDVAPPHQKQDSGSQTIMFGRVIYSCEYYEKPVTESVLNTLDKLILETPQITKDFIYGR